MLKKFRLKMQLKKFYKMFAEELDRAPFTIRIRDFKSYGFLIDVQYDVLQILEAYEDCFYEEAYQLHGWLTKLYNSLNERREQYEI